MAHRLKTVEMVANKPTGAKEVIKTKVADNSTNLSSSSDKTLKVTLINSRRIHRSNSDNQKSMTPSTRKLGRPIRVKSVSAEINTNNKTSTQAEVERNTLMLSRTLAPNCNLVDQRDNLRRTTTSLDRPNLQSQV